MGRAYYLSWLHIQLPFYVATPTVVPAKSDSDFMVYKVIRYL